MIIFILLLSVTFTLSTSSSCTTQNSVAYNSHSSLISIQKSVQSLEECCDLCSEKECAFFTYNGENSDPPIGDPYDCVLHNSDAPDHSAIVQGCTSGFPGTTPPAPEPPSEVNVSIEKRSSSSFKTLENYVCWNIDASRNRQFFDRNLSQASAFGRKLSRTASALGVSYLRFGGTGNDYLTYEGFGNTTCKEQTETTECLNRTWYTNLLDFTENSNAKMIFGLSMNTKLDLETSPDFPYPWDPSNAREILQWTIDQGRDHLIAGLELGNEQNKRYDAKKTAVDFEILYNMTLELWPDEKTRPFLAGPDPHSFHVPEDDLLDWISDFLNESKSRNVPIKMVTHHEYVEVESSTFLSPEILDRTGQVGNAVHDAVRSVDSHVLIVGGEIGPHNGGSPPCDHSFLRWSVFGDSFWYADAMASKALNGYSLFCRQDFIGADYGLVDCSSGTPLPDFYTALIYKRTMGTNVINTTVSTANASAIRSYASCKEQGVGLTVLLLNLAEKNVTVQLSYGDESDESTRRVDWVLSGSQDSEKSINHLTGLKSTAVELNGELCVADSDGTIPNLKGSPSSEGWAIELEGLTIGFYEFPDVVC